MSCSRGSHDIAVPTNAQARGGSNDKSSVQEDTGKLLLSSLL